MKKIKNFFMNPWVFTIGTGLAVALGTTLIDYITKEKIFSTLGKIISAIWHALIAFLNFEIKVWWLLILAVVLFVVLCIIAKHYDKQKPSEPKYFEYTQDYILGYKWKWQWVVDYLGKADIENLHPICDHCDTPLKETYTGYGRMKCLRCNKEYRQVVPEINDVKMMIADNVRRRYYPNE